MCVAAELVSDYLYVLVMYWINKIDRWHEQRVDQNAEGPRLLGYLPAQQPKMYDIKGTKRVRKERGIS
jgi:hypothetical protein